MRSTSTAPTPTEPTGSIAADPDEPAKIENRRNGPSLACAAYLTPEDGEPLAMVRTKLHSVRDRISTTRDGEVKPNYGDCQTGEGGKVRRSV